jgi:hypothetical protein
LVFDNATIVLHKILRAPNAMLAQNMHSKRHHVVHDFQAQAALDRLRIVCVFEMTLGRHDRVENLIA